MTGPKASFLNAILVLVLGQGPVAAEVSTFNGWVQFPSLTSALEDGDLGAGNLTNNNDQYANVLRIPVAGTIDRVGFNLRSVTTGGDIDVRLETLDSAGLPSGTLWGTNTLATVTLGAARWYEVTLTANASVVSGDVLAVVLIKTGGTVNAETDALSNLARSGSQAYVLFKTAAGSWSYISGPGRSYVVFTDDSIPDCGTVPLDNRNTAFNSASSPDERGLQIQFPFDVQVNGAWLYIGDVAGDSFSADFDVVLYDSDGTTVLASSSVDISKVGVSSLNALNAVIVVPFASDVTLLKNTTYRLAMKPTTTNSIGLAEGTIPNSKVFDILDGGSNFILTTRTDGGTWSQDSTIRPTMGLLLNGLETPGGAWGWTHRP